jgi:hypothetical protein
MWLEEGELNRATSAPNVAVYRSFCVGMLGAKFASENVRTTILGLLLGCYLPWQVTVAVQTRSLPITMHIS